MELEKKPFVFENMLEMDSWKMNGEPVSNVAYR
jgi:hypothetical protein